MLFVPLPCQKNIFYPVLWFVLFHDLSLILIQFYFYFLDYIFNFSCCSFLRKGKSYRTIAKVAYPTVDFYSEKYERWYREEPLIPTFSRSVNFWTDLQLQVEGRLRAGGLRIKRPLTNRSLLKKWRLWHTRKMEERLGKRTAPKPPTWPKEQKQ